MGDAPGHDPRAYLDEAATILRQIEEDRDITVTRASQGFLHAQAYASMATVAAMLMPTPEEVIATYEETREEVLGEVQADLVTRVERAKRILGDAQRDGSRRHPALHAALAALEGEE